jgi:hypothetical protein
MPFGDDDSTCISPDVDDVAKIIVGVVVRLSVVFLDALECALETFGAPLSTSPAPVFFVVIVW